MSSHDPLLLRALRYPRAAWPAWLRYPRAVLWSFIGIRRGAGARSELNEGGLRPLPLIACALGLAALFVFLLLGLASQASAQPARPAPLPEAAMAQRLQACTACHGEQGRASREGYVPRIAGKPAGYLEQQLLNFRDGRRRHAGMAYLLEHLSDDYLREIAAHFAAQRPPAPPPSREAALAPAQAARAEQLVRQGDPARRLPACAACHGAQLGGIAPGVPGLVGLPSDYLLAQLGAWREGQRRARQPDCMALVAQRLPAAELALVARWLAAQPLAEPIAEQPASWPLECGAVEKQR